MAVISQKVYLSFHQCFDIFPVLNALWSSYLNIKILTYYERYFMNTVWISALNFKTLIVSWTLIVYTDQNKGQTNQRFTYWNIYGEGKLEDVRESLIWILGVYMWKTSEEQYSFISTKSHTFFSIVWFFFW